MTVWMRVLAMILFFGAAPVRADEATRWLEQYEQALQKQDSEKMADWLMPDARVSVVMAVDDGEPMVISLSGEEFVQQQRALWNFSSEHRFSFAQKKIERLPASEGGGWRVAFTQQERYALFGSSLNRENQITVRLLAEGEQVRVSEIVTRTREW